MKNAVIRIGVFGLMMAMTQSFVRAEDAAPAAAAAAAPVAEVDAKVGNGKRLEKRVERTHQKINHMQEKGKISADEAAALNKKVDGIGAKVEANKAGGITQEERKEIRQELKEAHQELKKARKNKK